MSDKGWRTYSGRRGYLNPYRKTGKIEKYLLNFQIDTLNKNCDDVNK